MLTNPKKLLSPSAHPEKISILLVSPHAADLLALREILHHAHWELCRVEGVVEAERHIERDAPSVIVCERDLPDGNWKHVLHCAHASSSLPLLLVTSKNADESLWAEVLNLGGYDVLMKPFDTSEVVRVVGTAWRHSRSKSAFVSQTA